MKAAKANPFFPKKTLIFMGSRNPSFSSAGRRYPPPAAFQRALNREEQAVAL